MSSSLALRAAAELELRRRQSAVDPLKRLLDPDFTDVLWEYEHSRTEPLVPGNLHPKQAEVLESEARHRWLFWGNQVGKTTVGAVEVALIALGRHPHHQPWQPPVKIWASALTWDLWEKILLPELLTWLPPDRVIDSPPPGRKSTNRTIYVKADNGKVSTIEGKSAEQGADKYQSARVHVVWLDEEHPESIWNEMQPRLVRHGGITIGTMTPLKGFSWIYHRVYEPWRQGLTDPETTFCSHAGLADNPAIGEAEIEALKEALRHNKAQLAARLYGLFVAPEGLALSYDPARHLLDIGEDRVAEILKRGHPFAGIDFGAWRFHFALFVADEDRRAVAIDEVFSQRQTLEERARAIGDVLERWGIAGRVPIWGDAANPQDIIELNAAFARLGIGQRVVPVAMENKIRRASVERLNDLLGRDALGFRRGLGDGHTWMLGMNAASGGSPVEGSRLLWEIVNWCYPDPKEGKAQQQDPDDNSADGADGIAAMRYAVMSYYRAAEPETPDGPDATNYDVSGDEKMEQLRKRHERKQRILKRAVSRAKKRRAA